MLLTDEDIKNLFKDIQKIFQTESEATEPLFFDAETFEKLKLVCCLFNQQILAEIKLKDFTGLVKLDQLVHGGAAKASSTSESVPSESSAVNHLKAKSERGRYKKITLMSDSRVLLTAQAGPVKLSKTDSGWSLKGDSEFFVGDDFAPELFMEIFFEALNTDKYYPDRGSKLFLSGKASEISLAMETAFLPGQRLDRVLSEPIDPIEAIDLIVAMLGKCHNDVDNVISNYHCELKSQSSDDEDRLPVVNRFDLSRKFFSLYCDEKKCDPLGFYDLRSYIFLQRTLVWCSADKNQVFIFPVDDDGAITKCHFHNRGVNDGRFEFDYIPDFFNVDYFMCFNMASSGFRLYRDGKLVTSSKVSLGSSADGSKLQLHEEACSDVTETACIDAGAEAEDCMIRTNLAMIAHFFHWKSRSEKEEYLRDKVGNEEIRDLCKKLLSSTTVLSKNVVIQNLKSLHENLMRPASDQRLSQVGSSSSCGSAKLSVSNATTFGEKDEASRREQNPSPEGLEGEGARLRN